MGGPENHDLNRGTIAVLGRNKMKIKYFSDTDTALVEFSDRKVAETKEYGRKREEAIWKKMNPLPGLKPGVSGPLT